MGSGPGTIQKVRARLLPFIFICYAVAYLDRVNVGFAALEMNKDLGLSDTAYALGVGLFFWGYALLEVPSNLLLASVGARIWIARIMISWGFVSSAMMFATGPWSFGAMRLLLGVAEAGLSRHHPVSHLLVPDRGARQSRRVIHDSHRYYRGGGRPALGPADAAGRRDGFARVAVAVPHRRACRPSSSDSSSSAI